MNENCRQITGMRPHPWTLHAVTFWGAPPPRLRPPRPPPPHPLLLAASFATGASLHPLLPLAPFLPALALGLRMLPLAVRQQQRQVDGDHRDGDAGPRANCLPSPRPRNGCHLAPRRARQPDDRLDGEHAIHQIFGSFRNIIPPWLWEVVSATNARTTGLCRVQLSQRRLSHVAVRTWFGRRACRRRCAAYRPWTPRP